MHAFNGQAQQKSNKREREIDKRSNLTPGHVASVTLYAKLSNYLTTSAQQIVIKWNGLPSVEQEITSD